MNKEVKNWVNLSDYDLETAIAMFQTNRYIYVAFMCQQCIEKLLKAIYIKNTKETPPYTHNLIRLSELTKIEKLYSIIELNVYYINARYSEELDKIKKRLNKKKADELLKNTQNIVIWLKEKMI